MTFRRLGIVAFLFIAQFAIAQFAFGAATPTVSDLNNGTYNVNYVVAHVYGTLEERVGTSGNWTTVHRRGYGAGQFGVVGKSPGTYYYRLVDYDFLAFSGVFGSVRTDIPYFSGELVVVVTISGPPIALDTPLQQSKYTHTARRGDINADGRNDLYVKRDTGSPDNGVFYEAIATQGVTGNFDLLIPTAAQLATARTWSVVSVNTRNRDFTADGYIDAITTNLDTYFPNSVNQMIISPGKQYARSPIAISPWDLEMDKFARDMFNSLRDPGYFDDAKSVSQPGYRIELPITIGRCFSVFGFPVCGNASSTAHIGDYTLADLGLASAADTAAEEKMVRLNSEPDIQAQEGFSYNETLTCVAICGYYIISDYYGYSYTSWFDIWTPITLEGRFDKTNYSEAAFEASLDWAAYLQLFKDKSLPPSNETTAEKVVREFVEKTKKNAAILKYLKKARKLF